MRRAFLLFPLFVACAQTDMAETDSAAMAAAPGAILTEADIAGTWSGLATLAGTDSVIAHWTQVCGNGTCRGTSQEAPNDTITATYTIMADSVVGHSTPFVGPMMPGVQVVDHWTVRFSGDSVTGMGRFVLASNPDSVVASYQIKGARNP